MKGKVFHLPATNTNLVCISKVHVRQLKILCELLWIKRSLHPVISKCKVMIVHEFVRKIKAQLTHRTASTWAPFFNRIRTMWSWPIWAAIHNGLAPSIRHTFGSPFSAIRVNKTARCPFCDAINIGVARSYKNEFYALVLVCQLNVFHSINHL